MSSIQKLTALLAALPAVLLLLSGCGKCESIGTSSAPEVVIIDNNPASPRYNTNVGVLYFDVQQRENDGGTCGLWAAQVSYTIHNNTNQIMYCAYTLHFAGNTSWSKSDTVTLQPLLGQSRENFSNIGADYSHGNFSLTVDSILYQ